MKAKIVGLIGIVCLFLPFKLFAQVQLDSIPDNNQNTRFYNDVFNIQRPGLSLNGFDDGGNHSKGYGLKQILEMLYGGTADQIMVDTYNKIVQISKQPLVDPFNSSGNPLNIVNGNSNILQCRAFVALTRYVLYKNGITAQIPEATQTAPSHSIALSDMKDAFLKPEDWLLANSNHSSDQVKWTRTVGNYARALDLYLALENAFDYYGENLSDNRLLTKTQKYQVLLDLDQASQALDNYLYSLVDFGGIGNPAGVRFYEAEPGNRPMKMFLTMGYAALTMQNYASSNAFFTENREKDYLQKAFRSAGLQEESNSIKYWSYQTHNGKRFWAEGAYYFEFTMNDVIPFWHAIRINNMLNWNGNNISDPFSHSWFLNPLDWLADLSTPNGYLPPLDDGNKSKIDYANLLRWNSTYATSAQGTNVGKKFAWIGDKIKSSGESLDSHTLLVQLSMPHVSVGSGSPPKELVKNPISYVPGDGAEQQLILRRPDANGNTNYILLNGESGTAISRGEGHEQADQLQLLYYKNGKSYLMDSGYDRAGSTTNSTWNQYDLHNVIGVMNAQGDHGLPSPNFELSRGRKVAHHNSVTNLYQERVGNLDILNGRLVINNYSFI